MTLRLKLLRIKSDWRSKRTLQTTLVSGELSHGRNHSGNREQVLRRMVASQLGRADGVFTEDAEYQNIPMGPAAKGKHAIRKVIDSLMPTVKGLEIKIPNTAANGNVVFNERGDITDLGGGKRMELPGAGVFEVNGGNDREVARLLR